MSHFPEKRSGMIGTGRSAGLFSVNTLRTTHRAVWLATRMNDGQNTLDLGRHDVKSMTWGTTRFFQLRPPRVETRTCICVVQCRVWRSCLVNSVHYVHAKRSVDCRGQQKNISHLDGTSAETSNVFLALEAVIRTCSWDSVRWTLCVRSSPSTFC